MSTGTTPADMPDVPPHQVAAVDQLRAADRDTLAAMVHLTRAHLTYCHTTGGCIGVDVQDLLDGREDEERRTLLEVAIYTLAAGQ